MSEPTTGRPLWAEIDLDAVAHNVHSIQRQVGPNTRIMAVVKANAYGHGAVPVARTVLEAGATALGVACADEGALLRRAGISAPIVVLGYVPPWEAAAVVQHQLEPSVTTTETAEALSRAATAAATQINVHMKVDTGMNRLGVLPEDAPQLAAAIERAPGLRLEGVYSQFAAADEDAEFTRRQLAVFLQMIDTLGRPVVRHIANSGAVASLPEAALDMVRPGILLYGCCPSPEVGANLGVRPALSLKSRVVRLHTVPGGGSVSYGRTWTAQQDSLVALVPCGYADGLPRILSNRGAVLIHGQRAPIVGRVAMDQHVVDVTQIPDAQMHDEVVIIGRQGDAVIRVEEIAELASTISYEILCGITARVPRVYLRDNKIVERTTLLGSDC